MATLQSVLPAPQNRAAVRVEEDDDEDLSYDYQDQQGEAGPSSSASRSPAASSSSSSIPPYGQRSGWKPRTQADFGGGGAYPECHIAQYPLDMGREKLGANAGNKLAIRVDAEGNKRYDAIVKQGLRKGQIIQSQFKDLVPLSQRTDLAEKEKSTEFERPSEQEVLDTAERTRLALERITAGKVKTTMPKPVVQTGPGGKQQAQFIRYTPGQSGSNGTQRIIKMTEAARDPLEPPRHRFKKLPPGPPSPPPPVLRSPPRKITAQEQKDWMIPPSISNWKNNKGYTIPLDKRLAADGRKMQDVVINDNFAQFAEALNLADRHAREEVRQRSIMQQKLAAKEKAAREEHLRSLAQKAREERAGISSTTPSIAGGDGDRDDDASDSGDSRISKDPVGGARNGGSGGRPTAASMSAMLAGYGSDSGTDSGESSEEEEEDEGARERDRIREERRREREREMRMSNMGTEQRAKQMMKEQNRDISEKVALGLAKPTVSKESMTDSRLFNQEMLSANGYGDEDSYNLYDKPLFSGSSAAAAIYRRPAGKGTSDDIYGGGGMDDGFEQEMQNNDRFGLGKSKFQGADLQQLSAPRSGPVQFEKDTSDPFAINQFLDDAQQQQQQQQQQQRKGTKRPGLETEPSRKKAKPDDEQDGQDE